MCSTHNPPFLDPVNDFLKQVLNSGLCFPVVSDILMSMTCVGGEGQLQTKYYIHVPLQYCFFLSHTLTIELDGSESLRVVHTL